ncbi:MAG: DUF3520 domain-containing protein [bacterium]|nr:DUF3520 domain-containing protein [bacterium]
MKRHLQQNRHQLNHTEKEAIWQALPRPGAQPQVRRRTYSRPAAGVALALAAVACVMVWWTGSRVGDETVAMRTAPEPQARFESWSTTLDPVLESTPAAPLKSTTLAGAESAAPAEAVPPPPPRATVRGRVVDADTGEPLANANVLLAGTNRGVATDEDGRFTFQGLDPADSVRLEIRYLGYDQVALAVGFAERSEADLDVALEPMIVATLQAFDVEGAEYMVEVKSSVMEKVVTAETFEKYAIGSVGEALSRQSGIVTRAGEIYEPEGRTKSSDAAKVRGGGAPPPPKIIQPAPGSITGGTTPPNGESAELMYFEHAGVNPFIATEEDALSTFAVDVDDASWSVTRSYLERGALPPAASVRVEEFVNAFDPGFPAHTDDDLRIHVDGAPSRFGTGYHLLRIGVTGRDLAPEERRAANLVFVVDVSGSMGRENRLGAVRHSLAMLLDQLQEGDRVGIVVYGSRGEVLLQPTDVERRQEIRAAIDRLVPAGSTNAYEGLKLAYDMARSNYEADKINRLILCSDGVANNGATTVAEEMLALVRRSEDEGISLSTVGFGMGNYNDVLMEKLANQGDGSYAYVDRREEAEQVFRENLTGMLENVAREAKIQVEFDPERVARWRLLGYENRDVADRDFRNDAVDAGEIGAGHRVTALYEVKLTAAGRDSDDDLGLVRLRWEAPRHDTVRAGEITEIAAPLPRTALADRFGDAAPRLRLQATVAEFAEILRGSFWAKESTLEDLLAVAEGLAATEAGSGDAAQVARLVRAAARLQAEKEARAQPGER